MKKIEFGLDNGSDRYYLAGITINKQLYDQLSTLSHKNPQKLKQLLNKTLLTLKGLIKSNR